jgi:YD repeat-containing protein
MSNCRGCGSLVDPTLDEANQAVDEVLTASLKDAKKHGEICPLCGHSQAQPVSHRKSIQFAMLAVLLLAMMAFAAAYFARGNTERQAVGRDVLRQVGSNSQITQLLGSPLSIQGKVAGSVRQDETGWHEVKMTIPVHGPKADGTVQVSGGRGAGPWKFTTLEVVIPQLKKKADLITGRIVEYTPDAYVDIHTELASIPEDIQTDVPASRWNGDFPCVYAVATTAPTPQVGNCTTPAPMSRASRTPVDRFETDLRRGKFILRQTDLSVSEAGFDIPLTRTYASDDWVPHNKSHAFGLNANHPYDIAPLGTRNPYTEQFLVLEDGDFLFFPRVSKGTGYSDAIYRQSETGSTFYKAIQRWDGDGWLMQLQDGSTIHFPESYSARNLAQGAATEMTDAAGNKIQLIRNPQRDLLQIQGPSGASIHLSYDNHDRIVRAEDDHGAWTTYAYDSAGFLAAVTHSDGSARYYFYEEGQMTFVRDEQNRLLLHNFYDARTHWLQMQEFANGDVIQFRYEMSRNGAYATRATITIPGGTVKAMDTADSVSDVYRRLP